MELFAHHMIAHTLSLRMLGATVLVVIVALGLSLLTGDGNEG